MEGQLYLLQRRSDVLELEKKSAREYQQQREYLVCIFHEMLARGIEREMEKSV